MVCWGLGEPPPKVRLARQLSLKHPVGKDVISCVRLCTTPPSRQGGVITCLKGFWFKWFYFKRLTIVDTASKFNGRSLINRGQLWNANTRWQVLFIRWTNNSTRISVQYNIYERYPNLHVPLLERSLGIFIFIFFTHCSTGKSSFHGLFSSEFCGRNRINTGHVILYC